MAKEAQKEQHMPTIERSLREREGLSRSGSGKGSKSSAKRWPGKLTGSYTVSFNTQDAIDQLRGRPKNGDKPRIYGLKDFANRMQDVWMAAKDGDPFADYQLVQTESLLENTDQALRQMADELKGKLKQDSASYDFEAQWEQVKLARSNPVSPMTFEFLYAYHGAIAVWHLKRADDILKMIMCLHHMAVLPKNESRMAREAIRRWMRVVLSNGVAWRKTGVTRQDLKMKNQIALGAVEKLAQTQFLDMEMYRNVEEACEVFAQYAEQPKYGPRPAVQLEVVLKSGQDVGIGGPIKEQDS